MNQPLPPNQTKITKLHRYFRIAGFGWWIFLAVFLGILALIYLLVLPYRDKISLKIWQGDLPSLTWAKKYLPKPSGIEEQTYYVTLTENQIDSALQQINIPNTKNLNSKITTKQIETTGTYTKTTDIEFKMLWVPKVNSRGDVYVNVNDLTVGGIRMLPLMTTTLRDSLSSQISALINRKIIGKITDLRLESEQIVVTLVVE